jgi:multidrug resistance efflux pump
VTIEGDIEIDVRPYHAQVTAAVISLPVGIGQRVARGEVLAVLDDGQARLELTRLRPSLRKAQAALRDLQEAPDEQLRQAQMDIARNNVTIARQSLAGAQEELSSASGGARGPPKRFTSRARRTRVRA